MAALAEALRRPLVHARATVVVARAAVTVAREFRRRPFEEVVERLRRVPRAQRPDPVTLARVAGRLLPILPPWRMGRCLKRSLILLHLWSRAGLEPRLHLGFRPERQLASRGHAWLSVDEPALAGLCGSAQGSVEVVVL